MWKHKLVAIVDILFSKGFWLVHKDGAGRMYRANQKMLPKEIFLSMTDMKCVLSDAIANELSGNMDAAVDEVNEIINNLK